MANQQRKAVVIHESMFGNTRKVAEAIAEGLAASLAVDFVEVGSAGADTSQYDLVVAGGPTHAFSMSRAKTREDAVRQGAHPETTRVGLREWLDAVRSARAGQCFAAFDTRVEVGHTLPPGSAAKKAARQASGLGFEVIGRETFRVLDTSGPLKEGEAERARDWGADLAAIVRERSARAAR